MRWIAAHETITYAFVSSFALALLRTRTPEAWILLGERFPRLQGLIRALRGLGVDPVKVLRGLVQLLDGRSAERGQTLPSDAPQTDACATERETTVPSAPVEPAPEGSSSGETEERRALGDDDRSRSSVSDIPER